MVTYFTILDLLKKKNKKQKSNLYITFTLVGQQTGGWTGNGDEKSHTAHITNLL